MIRFSLPFMPSTSTLFTSIRRMTPSQEEKMSTLFTRAALGYDPTNIPQYVTDYRRGYQFFKEENFAAAQELYKKALNDAERHGGSQEQINLFKSEIDTVKEIMELEQKVTTNTKPRK